MDRKREGQSKTVHIQSQSEKRILLLADDGRMASLLAREYPCSKVVTEQDILEGIVQLSLVSFDLVLLNVEALEAKSAQAVKGIRHLGQNIGVYLYGEAFGEVFANQALDAGADDYLVWPVPLGELTRVFRRDGRIIDGQATVCPPLPSPADNVSIEKTTKIIDPAPVQKEEKEPKPIQVEIELKIQNMQSAESTEKVNRLDEINDKVPAEPLSEEDISLMAMLPYQELASLVPQGSAVLIQKAEEVLIELLDADAVEIIPDFQSTRQDDEDLTNEDLIREDINDALNRRNEKITLELNGPTGRVGQMVVTIQADRFDDHELFGKLSGNGKGDATDLDDVTASIGTLLHLSQRDEALRQLATTDELTGVYNRRYLERFASSVLEHCQVDGTEVTLLVFDIDEFKYYNDTYGHAAGDEILKQATQLIRRCCRAHDVVARVGGDEFAVLFWDDGQKRDVYPDHQPDDSEQNHQFECIASDDGNPCKTRTHSEMVRFLSNRFRRLMMTREFPELGPDGQRGILSISGGLASYPWDGKTVTELMAKADEALLQAKRSGKNRIFILGEPDNDSLQKA